MDNAKKAAVIATAVIATATASVGVVKLVKMARARDLASRMHAATTAPDLR